MWREDKMIESELHRGETGGKKSGGMVPRQGRVGVVGFTKEGGAGWREGGNTRARDGGWRGSGCLNSTETLRAFCMFAFVMIERWLAPCLLLIHEL